MQPCSRRRFLRLTGLTATAALVGCQTDPLAIDRDTGWDTATGDGPWHSPDDRPGNGGRPGETGSPAGSETGNTGVVDDRVFADTGPELERRVPGSLVTAEGTEHTEIALHVVSGELPADMAGHVFIACAIPYGDGSPIFTGDGLITRVDMGGGSASLTTRVMKTPSYYADAATVGTSWAFDNTGMARTSLTLGARNFANTAFAVMGDRLLVTSDAGRPFELDTQTNEIATPVGWMHEWVDALPDWLDFLMTWPFPVVMTTAHPGVDPQTGELFSVNYGMSLFGEDSFLDVVVWDGEGGMSKWQIYHGGSPVTVEQSVHQIAVTRSYVIVVESAFLVETSEVLGFSAQEMPSVDTVMYIVPRSAMVAGVSVVEAKRVLLPRETIHFFADFEDDGDYVTVHLAHTCAVDAAEFLEAGDKREDGGAMRNDLIGMALTPTDLGAMARYVIDGRTGGVASSDLVYDEAFWGGPGLVAHRDFAPLRYTSLYFGNIGFHEELLVERMVDQYASYPYRNTPLGDLPIADGRPSSLCRYDTDALAVVDTYAFPDGRVGLSPTFVPRQGGTDDTDGYILMPVISDDTESDNSSGDELWVFDAADLAAGPLARLGHPDLDLPFTLHTAYMPSIGARTATYGVDVVADLDPVVSKMDADIQQLFRDHVYPHFS